MYITRPKRKLKLLSTMLGSLLFAFNGFAEQSCIEDPKRHTPCPHQIYKLMSFNEDEPAKITCVCIADFEKFLTPAKNDTEIALRKMELKLLAAELQLTQEQVANLARR